MNNQQAINLLKGLEQSLDDYCELNDEGKTAFGMAITALELFGNSEQLPSAQPEPLTGKEKMIFLAAMAKEENICKQIDDEYRDCELYEDSLVRACQEIERKVRGALWT